MILLAFLITIGCLYDVNTDIDVLTAAFTETLEMYILNDDVTKIAWIETLFCLWFDDMNTHLRITKRC